MGYEEEELLPFKEPTLDISDQKRIEMLVGMGYSRTEVEESLRLHKFDDTYASYLLLGRKSTDVSSTRHMLFALFCRAPRRKSQWCKAFPDDAIFYPRVV